MGRQHTNGNHDRWARGSEDGESMAVLAGAAGRVLAAGWSAVWMALAALLLGVLIGFTALRAEARESVRSAANGHEPVATLRQALESANARAAAAEAASQRAQLAMQRVSLERDGALAERSADRRELALLRERIAATPVREPCPVVVPAAPPPPVSCVVCEQALSQLRVSCEQQVSSVRSNCEAQVSASRAGCEQQLGVARGAQARATAELQNLQTQCTMLLMLRPQPTTTVIQRWRPPPMPWLVPAAPVDEREE